MLPRSPPELNFDIDRKAQNMIIVDGAEEAYTNLMNTLLRTLSEDLPSLALKTGSSEKRELGNKNASTLEVAADTVQSGTPTLFLDVRPLPPPPAAGSEPETREMLIERAKQVSRWMIEASFACASNHQQSC